MTESQVMHENEFSIDSYRLKEINEICRDVKTMFRDWHDFVSESIALTITWWKDPQSAMNTSYEWFPHYTDEMKAEMKELMKQGNQYKKFQEDMKAHNKEYGISLTPRVVNFEDREPSHYRIDSLRLQWIQEIADEIDLYPSIEIFFDEALDLMITWWKRPADAVTKFYEMWPHMTEKQKELFKEKHPETYYKFEQQAQAYHEQKRNQEEKSKETIKQEPITNKITKELERDVIDDRKTGVMKEIIQQPPSLSESYSESEVIARDAEDAVRTLCAQLNDTSSTISELSLEKKITELSDAKMDQDSNIHGKLPYDEYPIIWAFYSRFFPVKVVVSVLADMIADNNGEMVEYDQLREKAYTVALGLSESIKDYEDKWRRKRNVKISAGLPQRPIDERYLSPRKRLEKMNKFNSSKDRFQNHFVGMSEETWNKKQNSKPDQKSIENKKPTKNENGIAYFDGALNAMGLANFVVEKVGEKNGHQYKIKVGLTPKGAEFYQKRNSVLVNYMDRRGHVDVALFPSESTFIRKNIIPKFSLEEMFVSKIEKELKGKTLGAKEIDSAFVTVVIDWLQKEEEKDVKNPWYSTIKGIRSDESLITPWRVATMGRLSEMGIVNWIIERKTGSSQFSLHTPTEEPPKITTN